MTTTAIWVGLIVVAAIVVIAVYAGRSSKKSGAGRDKFTPYISALGCLIDGRKGEALKFLKDAVREAPENVHAYMKLGDLMREKGDVERALQVHRELTVRRIDDPQMERELYRSLCRDYLAARRYGDARKSAERLLSFNKKDEEGLEVLACVFEHDGAWDKSYEVQEELVRMRKQDGSAFLALYRSYIGSNYMARGDKSSSKKYFESALHKDKDCLPALLYLGDIYYQEGDLKKAIEKWNAVASLFPQWAYIVFGRLEKAYYESGTFGEVERVYEGVLRARPNDIPTLLAMAEMNHKRGEFDEALRLVGDALELDQSCRRARQLLVRIRLEQGDPESALKDVMSFLEESRPGEGKFICADCGYESKEVLFRCPSCRGWSTFLN
jgi:lipopolysaccharide biosynthesis regulator YciM